MAAFLRSAGCALDRVETNGRKPIVQELLGHTRIDTTGIYTHLDKTGLRRSVHRTHPRNRTGSENR